MWALLLLLFSCALARALPTTTSFAVIFDCGSTGTRVHVFSWSEAEKSVGGLPDVTAVPGGNKKVTPGISSFEAHPESAGASITPLLELAERVVPAHEHSKTLVLLRATAGMRLLAKRRAQRIYTSLYEAVLARGTFRPRREDFGTLSGDDEGVFGWLSANYLLKRSGAISTLGSVGALDLGGGSTQITLATSAHASESSQIDPRTQAEAARPADAQPPARVPLPSGAVSVFTHSHLGFGNKAVLSALTASEAAACLAAGANASWEPSNKSSDYTTFLNRGANEGAYVLRGRGDFDECDRAVRRVLHGSFDRHGQPPLRRAKPTRFIAMSLFYYVEHFVDIAGHLPSSASSAGGAGSSSNGGAGSSISASQLLHAARKLCAEPNLDHLLGKDPLTTEDALRWRCFDAIYAGRLLTDGYGFGEHDASIDFKGEIGGVEVEWTLGALLNAMLYGSHQRGPVNAAGGHTIISPGATSNGGGGSLVAAAFGLAAFGLVGLAMRRACFGGHQRSPRSSRDAIDKNELWPSHGRLDVDKEYRWA
jgi:hypothetical protein